MVFFAFLCLCSACSRRGAVPEAAPQAAPEEDASGPVYPAADKLFAVVRPGDSPVWFEFGPEGPAHIASPEEAAPGPFRPWTDARFAAGMSLGPGRLVMAVNRYGFLVWAPQTTEAALYRLPEPAWDGLTVAALFRYSPAGNGGKAWDAALLYRDDVFSGADGGPPGEPVRALPSGGFEAEALDIPAFAPIPGREGWDIKSLRQGRDGAWYFRAVRGGGNPASVYYRAAEFGSAGDSVGPGVFRNAVSPYNYEEAPSVLRAVLEEAASLEGGKALLAAIVSPGYDAPRYFAAGKDGGGEAVSFTELSGFYLPPEFPGGEPGPFAAALFPDGRLVYAAGEGGAIRAALPALPEGFVYTRLGVAGTALLAAWEEQLEWNIGAAGFMVIKSRWEHFDLE
ncbi:MAG: hypothetical protein LBK05_11155 [Treponema sp.]|jgi:hypothetical protein|nr:hypothetical protein [Treponema sp.]